MTTQIEVWVVRDDGSLMPMSLFMRDDGMWWEHFATESVTLSNPHLIEVHSNGRAFIRPITITGPISLIKGDTLSVR